MQIRIDADDLKEITSTVKHLLNTAPEEMETLLQQTAKHIEGQARQLHQPDTGWLRKNIIAKKTKEGYEVQSNADYSLWVEYGTRKMTAKPYFRPAIERGMEYLEQELKNRFKI